MPYKWLNCCHKENQMGKEKPQKGCTRIAITDQDENNIIRELGPQAATQYMSRLVPKD
jgi:hypothetical protein